MSRLLVLIGLMLLLCWWLNRAWKRTRGSATAVRQHARSRMDPERGCPLGAHGHPIRQGAAVLTRV